MVFLCSCIVCQGKCSNTFLNYLYHSHDFFCSANRLHINQVITGSTIGKTRPGPTSDFGISKAPLVDKTPAYMALPAAQAIMNCLMLVFAAPAVIAAASANTGTGLLRNKITCVGVSGISTFNDFKRYLPAAKPIKLPTINPDQVQTHPENMPSRAPRKVPTILDGIGKRISEVRSDAPVSPKRNALSSVLESHFSPGNSPIIRKGTIGTSSAIIITNALRRKGDIIWI